MQKLIMPSAVLYHGVEGRSLKTEATAVQSVRAELVFLVEGMVGRKLCQIQHRPSLRVYLWVSRYQPKKAPSQDKACVNRLKYKFEP